MLRAQTDLVTILHADDRLKSNYAELMLAAAAAHPDATLFHCDAEIINAASIPVFSFPDFYKKLIRARALGHGVMLTHGDVSLANLMKGWSIMCPTVCYRLSRLAAKRFKSRWRMVVDVDLLAGLLLEGHTFVGLPMVAYEYRRHSENQTTTLTKELTRFQEESQIYDLIKESARKLGWQQTALVCEKKRIIKFNLAYCLMRDLISGRLPLARKKGSLLVAMLRQDIGYK